MVLYLELQNDYLTIISAKKKGEYTHAPSLLSSYFCIDQNAFCVGVLGRWGDNVENIHF